MGALAVTSQLVGSTHQKYGDVHVVPVSNLGPVNL